MHGRRLAFALALGLIAIAGGAVAASAQVKVVDAGGREVAIRDASRILCIGGDVTEIVYALGAGARVTAVDKRAGQCRRARSAPIARRIMTRFA
ncbi:MAG: hypothetical protein WAN86_25925 [Hyphomicrobiaceae bacterium]